MESQETQGGSSRGCSTQRPQSTVESQSCKTQAHDERPRRMQPGAAHLQTPITHPKPPQQIQRIPKPPPAQPRNRNPSPQTIQAHQNPNHHPQSPTRSWVDLAAFIPIAKIWNKNYYKESMNPSAFLLRHL